jgi:hypothetical protein
MRASSWRSPVRLFALMLPGLFLVSGACTPDLGVGHRPWPCAAGYLVCPSTGLCELPDVVKPNPLDKANSVCPSGYTVRQGLSIGIKAPGARAADVNAFAEDLVSEVKTLPSGAVVVEVLAPHGTTPGDETPTHQYRTVTIVTTSGGDTLTRQVSVTVSPIAAYPAQLGGNDDNLGTTENPFRTLRQAASVAATNDTIVLLNQPGGAASEPATNVLVALPAGVTLRGQDSGQTILQEPLKLLGGANLQNVSLRLSRLAVQVPGSKVVLQDVLAWMGVTIEATAVDSELTITGFYSQLRSDDEQSPLLVQASAARVTVTERVKVTVSGQEDLEAIRFSTATSTTTAASGKPQELNLLGSEISNSVGMRAAVRLEGNTKLLTKDGTFWGRLEILDKDSTADITDTSFLLIRGEGGIDFQGSTMNVTGATFDAAGIAQTNAASHVKVRNTLFSKYLRYGYRLIDGHLDLGTGDEHGNNTFIASKDTWLGMAPPTALVIEAPDKDIGVRDMNGVTVSATTFDPIASPSPCTIMGPASSPGLYEIANQVPIDFY